MLTDARLFQLNCVNPPNLAKFATPNNFIKKSLPSNSQHDCSSKKLLSEETNQSQRPSYSINERFKPLVIYEKQKQIGSRKMQLCQAVSMQISLQNGAAPRRLQRTHTSDNQDKSNFFFSLTERQFPRQVMEMRPPPQQSDSRTLKNYFAMLCEMFKINSNKKQWLCKYSDCMVFGIDSFHIIVQKKGRVFIGNIKNGLKDGRGVQWTSDKYYIGSWLNGQRQGYGVQVNVKERSTYKGQWKGGLKNGLATYSTELSTYKGSFALGVKHGQGEQIFADGTLRSGQFVNNELIRKRSKSYESQGQQKQNRRLGFSNSVDYYSQLRNQPLPILGKELKTIVEQSDMASRSKPSSIDNIMRKRVSSQSQREIIKIQMAQSTYKNCRFQLPYIYKLHQKIKSNQQSCKIPAKPMIRLAPAKFNVQNSQSRKYKRATTKQEASPSVEQQNITEKRLNSKPSRLNWQMLIKRPVLKQGKVRRKYYKY